MKKPPSISIKPQAPWKLPLSLLLSLLAGCSSALMKIKWIHRAAWSWVTSYGNPNFPNILIKYCQLGCSLPSGKKFDRLHVVAIFCYIISLGLETLAAQNFDLVLFFKHRSSPLWERSLQDLEREISDNCPNPRTECWWCWGRWVFV